MKKDFARKYRELEQWHWWFLGRERIIEAVLRRGLKTPEPRTILSLGCGPAEGLARLAPFGGREGKVIGLDLELLHAHATPHGVQFVAGTLENTPFEKESFDLVLALDVLEHVDRDTAALSEAVRVLKPGGLLLITVPALPSLWGNQDVVAEHHRRYTKRTLTQLFDVAGVSGYRLLYFNSILLPVIASVRWWRRLFGLKRNPRSDFEIGRPGVLNDVLAMLFGAERHLIERAPFPLGVSLLAIYSHPRS